MISRFVKKVDINSIPYFDISYCRDTFFFDIETTGFSRESERIYMIGLACLSDDENEIVITQLMTESAADEKALLCEFILYADGFNRCVTYNGKAFDVPFLKARIKKYRLSHDLSSISHLDLYIEIGKMKNFIPFGNRKQKGLEQFLGIEREDKYDGGKLISVYLDYEKTKDEDSLSLLLLHNYEDMLGMCSVTSILSYKKILKGGFHIDRIETDIKSGIYVNATLAKKVPVGFTHRNDYLSCRVSREGMAILIPVFAGRKKLYYKDFKNYYYLPNEDRAVHKSVGRFVDKKFRVQAKASNCYESVDGSFIYAPDISRLKKSRTISEKLTQSLSSVRFLRDDLSTKNLYIRLPIRSLPEGLDADTVLKSYIISHLGKSGATKKSHP